MAHDDFGLLEQQGDSFVIGEIARGVPGPPGEKGDTGNGIDHIAKTSSEGVIDTYTVFFTDGTTWTYHVANSPDEGRISTLESTVSGHGTRLTAAEGKITTDEANITKLTKRTDIVSGTVTLKNNVAFPFNSSQVTVPIAVERDNQNYIVDFEVTEATGNVGDIIVSAKLVNGFKIEHTGSATSVTVKYQVLGGMT